MGIWKTLYLKRRINVIYNSCVPPVSVTLDPNPPRLNTDCSVLIKIKLVHDYFGGTVIYDVRGPKGFHVNGETEATPDRPYHTGETLTKNFTYHLPPFVKDGVPFRGNLSFINDEGQLLGCVHAFCKFAPGTGY
ncbi:hypothetical protein BSL78_05197 [Apostichopus japonicus]|uniref:Uncharacterized protein n=1 Tax=Stichopus japonicus TaxID=307972 RepID=A0A2G8LCB6_STIJA|nr:hypothetical protein BSL78_05197 [Apostichopus japonicus]